MKKAGWHTLQRRNIRMVTSPIRTQDEIELMKNYFITREHYRDYAMFVLGINTALRIGDLLNLRWLDVYDKKLRHFRKHIYLTEHKTQKQAVIALNSSCIAALDLLRCHRPYEKEDEFIFCPDKKRYEHISRTRAWKIIKDAADANHLDGNISCHSLRKTFGYHAWKRGASSTLIMNIYNHSSMEVTKRYLSITQDEKDDLYNSMNL